MAQDLTPTAGPGRAPGAETSATAPASPAGYELLHEIGRGGMGVVYRARDTALGRDVAVKLLADRYPADSPAARRFLMRESDGTARRPHPRITPDRALEWPPLWKAICFGDSHARRPGTDHWTGRDCHS